jgi:hypothetical protein
MFQYVSGTKIVEDTPLLSMEEAQNLWAKYERDVIYDVENEIPCQLAIWKDCRDITDYGLYELHIDSRDHEYRVADNQLVELVTIPVKPFLAEG